MMKQQDPIAKSARPTVLFVHIQKTAGTTLYQIIARNYRTREVFALFPNLEAQRSKYIGMSSAEKGKIRLIMGHMHYGMHELVPGPSAYFTFLREPIDRVISQYYFIRRSPLHPAHRHIVVNNLDLKTVLERGLDAMLFNAQVRVLSGARLGLPPGKCTKDHLELAKRNLRDHFEVVGLTEEFDASLLLLRRAFGWRHLYYTRRNVAPQRRHKDTLPAETLAAVTEANQLDLELYAFAQALFEEQMTRYETLARDMARFKTMNQFVEPFLRQYMRLREYSVRTEIREKLWRVNELWKGGSFYQAPLRMESGNCPKAPIPEPLHGTEYGTFTNESIVERLPDLGRRMLAENRFSPAVAAELESLINGIPEETIRLLKDDKAPDAADWNCYVTPHEGKNWLEAPWFLVETYFYRLVLEITGYFSEGPGKGVDPFAYQKRQGLRATREAARALSSLVVEWFHRNGQEKEELANLLAVDLWGNQADLSMWPTDDEEKPDHQSAAQQKTHTLVDDSAAILEYLHGSEGQLERIDIILDNAGFELIVDLYLAAYLLEKSVAKKIHLHAKKHPSFVSDAMIKDVLETVASLAEDQHEDTSALGQKLQHLWDDGRLRVQDDWFWTSPLAMWQMPDRLGQELSQSRLVISKGDANYRRLLGDRYWPYSTPFADIVCYMPAPTVALRTLKSEIAAGLPEGQAMKVAKIDRAWLYNGRWGVIQFACLA